MQFYFEDGQYSLVVMPGDHLDDAADELIILLIVGFVAVQVGFDGTADTLFHLSSHKIDFFCDDLFLFGEEIISFLLVEVLLCPF